MESNKSKSILKQILYIFIPVFCAILIQYGTTICDVIILFVRNVTSKKTVDKSASLGELMNRDIDQPMNQAYLLLATYILYIVVFGLWYKKKYCNNKGLKETLFVKPSKKIVAIIISLIFAGYTAQIFADGVMALAKPHFEKTFEEYDKLSGNITGAGSSYVMLFTVFFIAPIGEELLFRGLMLNESKKIMPASYAILLQALVFSIYHGNIIQIIYAFVFGIVLGYIANYFKSILPSILLHMAINSSLLFIPKALYDKTGTTIATTVAALILFIVAFIFSLRKYDAKKDIN